MNKEGREARMTEKGGGWPFETFPWHCSDLNLNDAACIYLHLWCNLLFFSNAFTVVRIKGPLSFLTSSCSLSINTLEVAMHVHRTLTFRQKHLLFLFPLLHVQLQLSFAREQPCPWLSHNIWILISWSLEVKQKIKSFWIPNVFSTRLL